MNAIQILKRSDEDLLQQKDVTLKTPTIQTITVDAPSTRKPYIFIKSGREHCRIPYADIYCIKASGSYCEIVTNDKTYTFSASLSKVLEQLITDDIVRCHRSFAVNVDRIRSFDDSRIYLDRKDKLSIPISISYRSVVLGVLPRLRS